MAATDTFLNFLNTLTSEDRAQLKDYIKRQQAAMFAARSEEARVRLAHEFIHETRNLIRK